LATILAVCKDTGGTNGLLPVVRELRAVGHVVALVANEGSAAVGVLNTAKENFGVWSSYADYLDCYGVPDVLLTDMSNGGGIGWDLVWDMNRAKRPSFALQDAWAGCLVDDWADAEHRPSYILVGDTIGAEAVKKAWPEFNPERIGVVGYPALDKYANPTNIFAEAERMKKQFAVEFVPSVFYAGSTLNGYGLKLLVEAIELTHRRVDLIVRPHPGMDQHEPEEIPIWEEAIRRFQARGAFKVVAPSCDEWSTGALIAAADVTVSAYSTCLLEAVMLRKSNINLWTPEIRAAFMSKERGFGGLLDEFPPATLGCTVSAESVGELGGSLRRSFNEGLNLREAQERHYPNDGKNARRAAEFIHACITV